MIPHIRWMIRRDMPEVLAIEKACYLNPWPDKDFIACLRQRSVIGMVAEAQDVVVGYMIYELQKASLDVLDLAVHPKHHRRGVGTAMVARLAAKLSQHRRTRIVLMVHDANLQAQLFFRSQGFRATHVERGYFSNGDDGYAMQRRLEAFAHA